MICIAATAPAPLGGRSRRWQWGQRPDDAELGREVARLRNRHEQTEEAELQLATALSLSEIQPNNNKELEVRLFLF